MRGRGPPRADISTLCLSSIVRVLGPKLAPDVAHKSPLELLHSAEAHRQTSEAQEKTEESELRGLQNSMKLMKKNEVKMHELCREMPFKNLKIEYVINIKNGFSAIPLGAKLL